MKKRIIWVNGSFDVINRGHLKLLEFAKNKGELLYIGLDSDYRITQRKGDGYPINNWETRYEIMSALRWVDKVMMFDTDYQLEQLIATNKPDLIVYGEGEKNLIGSQFCENVTFFPRFHNNLSNIINLN